MAEGAAERSERCFFVPEVVQTSAMDCGPASLKALLEGYGISVSYGRLREACQTNVDGTSIDTMEDIANQLGLEAEQVMVPADHLLLSSAQTLPAIVVVRLSNGLTHFVVVWSRLGRFLQVMDPATGRRWPVWKSFLNEVYIHNYPVEANAWREWAGSEGFLAPLAQRWQGLHMEEAQMQSLQEIATRDAGWHSLAALDASTRMVEAIVRAGGMGRGHESAAVIDRLFPRALEQAHTIDFLLHRLAASGGVIEEEISPKTVVPLPYWSVQPYVTGAGSADAAEQSEPMLMLTGAVLVRVAGRRAVEPLPAVGEGGTAAITSMPEEGEAPTSLPPELAAALKEPPVQPGREILKMLKVDGNLTPSLVVFALAMASVGVLLEAFLLQGLIQIGQYLPQIGQRILAIGMFFAFFILMAGLEFPTTAAILRIGRRLETRLRVTFLEKLPRLSDRYFHSRLISDMTQRAHELRALRTLPEIAVNFLRLSFQIILTTLGIIWLDPLSAPLAFFATLVFILFAVVTKPFLDERDLRVRTHLGALDRFYLDAMLGLIPVRAHGAEKALRREHESLLVEWVHASLESLRLGRTLQAVSAITYSAFAVWLVFNYVAQGGQPSGILLLFYWTLNLPALGQNLVLMIQQYPMERNTILRILEPIQAPDEDEVLGGEQDERDEAAEAEVSTEEADGGPVRIEMHAVCVKAGGHRILEGIDLHVEAGEHIAVLGVSGAGKSTLVGLLLGWHKPESGLLKVDGVRLDGKGVRRLRERTAWVDPAVQLWNRSLMYNLQYGSAGRQPGILRAVVEEADLFATLSSLPDGLQTVLGEGGGLVSGGEGQRVRLGRAMLRAEAGLVILDEPFRGVDREKRRILLARARQHWQKATLFCVTHDVGETLNFPRVLVVENGRIFEDGPPQKLKARRASRYQAMLKAEEEVRVDMWASADWRRLWIENGELKEET